MLPVRGPNSGRAAGVEEQNPDFDLHPRERTTRRKKHQPSPDRTCALHRYHVDHAMRYRLWRLFGLGIELYVGITKLRPRFDTMPPRPSFQHFVYIRRLVKMHGDRSCLRQNTNHCEIMLVHVFSHVKAAWLKPYDFQRAVSRLDGLI